MKTPPPGDRSQVRRPQPSRHDGIRGVEEDLGELGADDRRAPGSGSRGFPSSRSTRRFPDPRRTGSAARPSRAAVAGGRRWHRHFPFRNVRPTHSRGAAGPRLHFRPDSAAKPVGQTAGLPLDQRSAKGSAGGPVPRSALCTRFPEPMRLRKFGCPSSEPFMISSGTFTNVSPETMSCARNLSWKSPGRGLRPARSVRRGKSTLLRTINGLESFDDGSIQVDEITPRPPAIRAATRRWRRSASGSRMIFQQFHLFPHRSVLDNIVEAPVPSWATPAEVIPEAEALLERGGDDRKDPRDAVGPLGGQQQRAAIFPRWR